MIDKIKNVPNRKIIDLEYLRHSKLPLILYGAGSYATDVKRFLNRNNLQINEIVLEEDYYKPNLFFEGYLVRLLCEVLDKYESVNIIIAFSKYREKMTELSSYPNVSKCIFIDAPDRDTEFFNYSFIKNNISILKKLHDSFIDDYSRNILIAFINAKISGCPDDLYNLNIGGEEQYFPTFLHLSEYEIFVDCGAFDGDTILSFNKYVNGKYTKIYAFECDKTNLEKLRKNISNLDNVEIIEKAAWSKKTSLFFLWTGQVLLI